MIIRSVIWNFIDFTRTLGITYIVIVYKIISCVVNSIRFVKIKDELMASFNHCQTNLIHRHKQTFLYRSCLIRVLEQKIHILVNK